MPVRHHEDGALLTQYGFLTKLFEKHKIAVSDIDANLILRKFDNQLMQMTVYKSSEEASRSLGLKRAYLKIASQKHSVDLHLLCVFPDGSTTMTPTYGLKPDDVDPEILDTLFGDEMRARGCRTFLEPGVVGMKGGFDLINTHVRDFRANYLYDASTFHDIIREGMKELDVDDDALNMTRFHGELGGGLDTASRARWGFRINLIRKQLNPESMKLMNRSYMRTLQQFEVLEASSHLDGLTSDHLNTQVAYAASTERHQLRMKRHQAFNAYPVLTDTIMAGYLNTRAAFEGHALLGSAIDNGEKLGDALAIHFRIPLSAVRKIQGLHIQRIGNGGLDDGSGAGSERKAPVFARILAGIAPEHHPRSKADWVAATQGHAAISGMILMSSHATMTEELGSADVEAMTMAYMRQMRGDWFRLSEMIADITTIEDVERDLRIRISSLAISESRSEPDEFFRKHSYHRALAMIRLSGSDATKISDIGRVSRHWHQEIDARAQAISLRYPEVAQANTGWQPLIGEVAINGLVLREIHDRGDLLRQGTKEMHCVGGYCGRILQGDTLIFSAECEQAGVRKIVATISLVRDQQHRSGVLVRTEQS